MVDGQSGSGTDRSTLPDTGVAATGYVCQNFPEHPGQEPKMVSAEEGVICPECGRRAGGHDDEIPYGDPPEYATGGGTAVTGNDRSGEWESHWPTDPTLTSGARDGFTLDVNETQLLFRTYGQHTPMLVEIWVEDESEPLGAINTAKGETVCLGGVEESLADRIDEIREMPIEEMPAALEQLAYRLNPSGRGAPETTDQQDTDSDRWEVDDGE